MIFGFRDWVDGDVVDWNRKCRIVFERKIKGFVMIMLSLKYV